MAKIALILSGCGHLDGAEIREAILSLLYLDKNNAEVQIFAPDIKQTEVINHLTNEKTNEERNLLVEAARIARGKISPLSKANAKDFDGVIIPGGWGVAKNLSSLAFKGPEAEVLPELKNLILNFISQKKPIGAICIAPAMLVKAVSDKISPTVTIGDDNDNFISALGGTNKKCASEEFAYDAANNIVSCSAYMREDRISKIAEGIEKTVNKVIELTKA